ncbi:hypothetical protein ACA910_003844 [Epithemia clementina (nom. ined.)]
MMQRGCCCRLFRGVGLALTIVTLLLVGHTPTTDGFSPPALLSFSTKRRRTKSYSKSLVGGGNDPWVDLYGFSLCEARGTLVRLAVPSSAASSGTASELLVSQQKGKKDKSTWSSSSSSLNQENNDHAAANDHEGDNDLWTEMLLRFQGDFDNYHQVVQDRQEGKLPREGGGHEHIHCTLVPVAKDARLAAFYFDGQPRAIFRFRYYQLKPTTMESADDADRPSSVISSGDAVDTFLYTLHPELEQQLRQAANPLEWPDIFRKFQTTDNDDGNNNKVQLLESCQVRWSYDLDMDQHSYVPDEKKDDGGIHAVMVHGEALVDSQMIPGHKILIRDQLSLWRDELWIHDRGHDPNTMAFIYGNQRGIPYRLRRVSNIIHHEDDGKNNNNTKSDSKKSGNSKNEPSQPYSATRSLVGNDLAWTLGPEFRTEDAYQEKINAMGGPSRNTAMPNRKK